MQIQPCKVLYVEYQSEVDWRSARDILRCNPQFHSVPRFDSVIYSADDDPLAIGQLELLFRCRLPGNTSLDLAMIRPFRRTSWKPKTRTDCPIREATSAGNSKFIALAHVVRGALLCPTLGGRAGVLYAMDYTDEDMYLRIHNIH
jgi:hypothetical protein